MRFYKFLWWATLPLLLVGCVQQSSRSKAADQNRPREELEEMIVNSRPAGALATFSTGESCKTPCRLTKRSGESFTVTLSKEGYKSNTVKVANNLETLREYNRTRAKGDFNPNALRVERLRLVPNPVEVVLEPTWSKGR